MKKMKVKDETIAVCIGMVFIALAIVLGINKEAGGMIFGGILATIGAGLVIENLDSDGDH